MVDRRCKAHKSAEWYIMSGVSKKMNYRNNFEKSAKFTPLIIFTGVDSLTVSNFVDRNLRKNKKVV
jgi:hypothetical protein